MLYEFNFEIKYYASHKEKSLKFNRPEKNEDLSVEITKSELKNEISLSCRIIPHHEIKIKDISVSFNRKLKEHEVIFMNGYQSWTDSREYFQDEIMKSISLIARPVIKKYSLFQYGDYNFVKYTHKKGKFHGFTYSYLRNGDEYELIGSLTEKNGFTVIDIDVPSEKIVIKKDCKGYVIQKQYNVFDIVFIKGNEKEVFDKYFDKMNIQKPKVKPANGWTSWYNYYQNISEDIIIENLENFSKYYKDIDIFQIDDGYQEYVGDWLKLDKNKFPNGMKRVAYAIKNKGYKAGLWLAPFAVETKSEIFHEKPHWIKKDKNGKPVIAGCNWSGFYALDFYNHEVRDYLRKVFSTVLDDWKFDMVKLDFLYAVCIEPPENKTRGEVMCEAMEFLRELVGNKIILGCGVPLGAAFGLVDYCRIGCDVGLDWNDKWHMQKIHRERVSTINAIRNAIGRRHLDGRAFINDPDVFLLRDDNIKLTENQKITLAFINSLFGNLIFTSDNISKYDEKKKMFFGDIMKIRSKEIIKTETTREKVLEVHYIEDREKFIAFVNLSELRQKAMLKEISTEIDKYSYKVKDTQHGNITLDPFETRIFRISE